MHKWFLGVARTTTLKHLLVIILGLVVFLTDNSNLTSASSFDNHAPAGGAKKHKLRLPASASAKPVYDFDCRSLQDHLEINTEFETVRLQGLNCPEKITVENTKLKNNLITFPVDKKTYSSEFAYLARGENTFLITTGTKKIHLSVYRY